MQQWCAGSGLFCVDCTVSVAYLCSTALCCRQWGGGSFCGDNFAGLPAEPLTECFFRNGTAQPAESCYAPQVWLFYRCSVYFFLKDGYVFFFFLSLNHFRDCLANDAAQRFAAALRLCSSL